MTSLLIYLVIILAIVAVVQILRVFELSNFLNGEDGINVTDRETNNISLMWVLFLIAYFAGFIYLVVRFGPHLLPEAASEHGAAIDTLMDFNLIIITAVFVLTHIVMIYFVYRYAKTRSPKATYVTHNNKLEFIWTIAPAIVLAIIIIYGINTWNKAMREKPNGALNIELYARQFDWTARYAGQDTTLGHANFLMISGTNPLGLINNQRLDERLGEYDQWVSDLEESRGKVYPGGKTDREILDKISTVKKHKALVEQMKAQSAVKDYSVADDDIIVKGEFHIPVGKPVNFQIRSQDVIHSAYMPHFRAQMNAVPGMMTSFYFTPTITSEEMRNKLGNPEFDYLLYCNKICGAAHYNMQMKIIVETEEAYNQWLAEQKKFYTADAQ
ncbi:cytochrome c oxidase subunit II [bacterium SCSIO 12741]|nr:cytochrome c oxidase subunit II [bacterium SCSIO 12741]